MPSNGEVGTLSPPRGYKLSPHRKLVTNVSSSSVPIARHPKIPLPRLQPSRRSPLPSLLQSLSSPKPKSMTLWDCIWRSLNSRTNHSHLQVTMELAKNQIDLKQLTSYQLAQNVLDLQMESQELQRDRSLTRQSSPGQSMKAYPDLVYVMTSREPSICSKFLRKTSNS